MPRILVRMGVRAKELEATSTASVPMVSPANTARIVSQKYWLYLF